MAELCNVHHRILHLFIFWRKCSYISASSGRA